MTDTFLPKLSVIIPVYNRADELTSLLASIRKQGVHPHEIIIVDDGSDVPLEDIIKSFKTDLNIVTILQDNKGPAEARNTGAKQATGDWFVFFDSDCELPEGWFSLIIKKITSYPDMMLFGGPDRAMADFTSFQKGINYAMTSILTTGGIRGGEKQMDVYYPRTFNMGVKREAFETVGGFSNLRFGEDVDFSMNVVEKGFECRLISDAWVYHRRRTSIKAFFKQVFNSGMARLVLEELHPGTFRIVHILPAFFTIFVLFSFTYSFASLISLIPLGIIGMIWFVHAFSQSGSMITSFWALICSFVQLTGYGSGNIWAYLLFLTSKKKLSEQYAFRNTFYD